VDLLETADHIGELTGDAVLVLNDDQVGIERFSDQRSAEGGVNGSSGLRSVVGLQDFRVAARLTGLLIGVGDAGSVLAVEAGQRSLTRPSTEDFGSVRRSEPSLTTVGLGGVQLLGVVVADGGAGDGFGHLRAEGLALFLVVLADHLRLFFGVLVTGNFFGGFEVERSAENGHKRLLGQRLAIDRCVDFVLFDELENGIHIGGLAVIAVRTHLLEERGAQGFSLLCSQFHLDNSRRMVAVSV
jgi:hypothetical protein